MKKIFPTIYLTLLFGISYYLSVKIGMYFIADGVAFFWPASGIACGFFIFSEKRIWPYFIALFIPAYIYPLIQHGGYSTITMALLCLANVTQSVLAGILIQSRVDKPTDINRLSTLLNLIIISAAIAPIISSLIGAPTFYYAFGGLSLPEYFLFWFIGNCAGILPVIIFMSVLVNFKKNFLNKKPTKYYIHRLIFACSYIALIYWMSSASTTLSLQGKITPYFIFPFILFSSLCFGVRFTGIVSILFSCFAAYYSAQGLGPYISSELPTVYNVISFDIFVITLTVTGLLLASIQFELSLAKKQLQSEKNEAVELSYLKTQFIANINHEIRTPITGIVGATDLLRTPSLSKHQLNLINVIKESCGHLLTLISNVLEFSRLESESITLQKKQFDIEALTHDVIKRFIHTANEKGINIYIDCRTSFTIIESDVTAMQQVISNLIGNSVKFTTSGYVLITIEYQHSTLTVSVKDTGVGISKNKIDSVFNSFVQEDTSMNRKHGGAGLGLSIVQKLTHMMDGSVSATSEKNNGSIFTVKFNIIAKQSNITTPQDTTINLAVYSNDAIQSEILQRYFLSKEIPCSFQPWSINEFSVNKDTIAIINWEGMNPHQLEEYCYKHKEQRFIFLLPWFMEQPHSENAKFAYSPAYTKELMGHIFVDTTNEPRKYDSSISSGTQNRELSILLADDNPTNLLVAKSILEKRGCQVTLAENGKIATEKARGNTYDLILMDIQMPLMDGFTAAAHIREFSPSTPIAAFTANSNEQLLAEFNMAGMSYVLPKPIDTNLLDAILKSVKETMRAR